MDGRGDKFLSRSGFSKDKYARIGGRNSFDLLERPFQTGAITDNCTEGLFAPSDLFRTRRRFRGSFVGCRSARMAVGVFDRGNWLGSIRKRDGGFQESSVLV